jgi:hypothetical protein
MAAYRPDRSGRGETPSARRRARRRALSGVDPAASSAPKKVARPPQAPREAREAPAGAATEQRPAARQRRPWFEWRGWDSVITYVVLAVMLAGLISGVHRLLAAGVLVIGVSALVWGVTHRPGRRRTTSGYGVLLDWLMNVLPRPVYLVLCVLVTALGIIGVIIG